MKVPICEGAHDRCGTQPIQDTVKGERKRMVHYFLSSGPNLLWLLNQDITMMFWDNL